MWYEDVCGISTSTAQYNRYSAVEVHVHVYTVSGYLRQPQG